MFCQCLWLLDMFDKFHVLTVIIFQILQMLVKFGRMFATFVKIPLNNVFEHYYLYSWFKAQTESRALRTQLSSKKSEKNVCQDLHEIDSDTRCPQFPSASKASMSKTLYKPLLRFYEKRYTRTTGLMTPTQIIIVYYLHALFLDARCELKFNKTSCTTDQCFLNGCTDHREQQISFSELLHRSAYLNEA